ncbi:MAG: hypothetical protein VYA51_12815 [Planctomycetota bacterium]|nr:hypothetical protein [Planctomycetota bacterium]
MGNPSVPDLDIDPAEFESTYNDHVVVTKTDRDDAGNVRTAWPSSMIASRFTAGWGNFVDDALRALQQLARGPARIGTAGDLSADAQATLNWDATNGRVRLRNAANSAFRDLQIGNLFFSGGPRIITRNGSPEGSEVAGAGSVCLDYSTDDGRVWKKTTSAGNTGWAELGAGTVVEHFGYDGNSSSADQWVPFGPHVIETASSNAPRAYHIWRAPQAGNVSRITIVSEGNPGASVMRFYEPDGTTVVQASDAGVTTSVPGTSGATELFETVYTFSTPAAFAAGDMVCLEHDVTTAAGEVVGWIELGS